VKSKHKFRYISYGSIIIVESSAFEVVEVFRSLSVRQLFVSVVNLEETLYRVRESVEKFRCRVLEVISDDYSIVEGPEGMLIHLVTSSHSTKDATDDLMECIQTLLNSEMGVDDINQTNNKYLDAATDINSKLVQSTVYDGPSIAKDKKSNLKNSPRPVFNTLNCTIKTKKPQFITARQMSSQADGIHILAPCPPNSRIPIPFETDIFKGYSLLLIRTDPIDISFTEFFSGKK
jgi:hypothetical protein